MTVDEAYDFCRAITHEHGGNFSVGFRFLPAVKRRAVYAAYAYCRFADDIADEPGTQIMERLAGWQQELEACYAGSPSHPVTIALADALQNFAIPKSAFIALIDGCRQDTVKTRYETFEELLAYCDMVATSISDISLSIFGYRTSAALAYGRSLATALQLTNVTRDVGDDLGRDRIYIPAEELRRFGVSERELADHTSGERVRELADHSGGERVRELADHSGGERVRELIEFQIARAERYFHDAEPLLRELDFDARFPTLLMGGVYATVLRKLRKDPLAAIQRRLRLTTLQKLLVIGSRILRPHFV